MQKLYSILLQIKNEIRYLYNTLPDCFDHLCQQEEPFAEWFNHLTNRIKQHDKEEFMTIWKSELDWLLLHSALEKEDLQPLYDIGQKLEEADINIKLQAIDFVLLHLEQKKDEYQTLLSQKKKMCTSLCAFGGALTLILLL